LFQFFYQSASTKLQRDLKVSLNVLKIQKKFIWENLAHFQFAKKIFAFFNAKEKLNIKRDYKTPFLNPKHSDNFEKTYTARKKNTKFGFKMPQIF
jgi:hypothetical protein